MRRSRDEGPGRIERPGPGRDGTGRDRPRRRDDGIELRAGCLSSFVADESARRQSPTTTGRRQSGRFVVVVLGSGGGGGRRRRTVPF